MKKYTIHQDPLQPFPAIAKLCYLAEADGTTLSFHIGLDTELAGAAVCAVVDGGSPRNLGKASRETILTFVKELVDREHRVAISQESCGFGPYFHRQLDEVGAHSHLVAPENLNARRKTDKTDARQLALRLFDFDHHGNKKAIRLVRDLGEPLRQRRALGRHRAQLQKARNQLAGNGRGIMTEFGYLEVPDGWWGRRKWPKLRIRLEKHGRDWVVGLLDPMVDTIRTLHDRCRELESALDETREEVTKSIRVVPKGVGDLTMNIVESEVGDWNRFRNRGQAGSFTGLCSGERSSAGSCRQGAIDRQGNGRIRKQLVEAVWRLQQWNPGWRGFQKFAHVFGGDANIGPATRKKAVVACARMLMIDLWRLNTDQTTLENLGLKS